jgi:hypothetical protein
MDHANAPNLTTAAKKHETGDRVLDRQLNAWGTIKEVRKYGNRTRADENYLHMVEMDSGGFLSYLAGDPSIRVFEMRLYGLFGLMPDL